MLVPERIMASTSPNKATMLAADCAYLTATMAHRMYTQPMHLLTIQTFGLKCALIVSASGHWKPTMTATMTCLNGLPKAAQRLPKH